MLGESASFRELCGQAIPAVYSYVLPRVGGDVAVAQDVTSEAMLAGVAAFRRGEGDRLSQAWFITVARRRLVDRWRRGERESRRLRLVWAAGRGDDERLDVEEPVSRARIVAVMASLRADHQAALTLRYLDGLSVAEVAGLLGRSVHATESLLARARRAFKDLYRDTNDG